jgi:type IV pilus assembly protein PilM
MNLERVKSIIKDKASRINVPEGAKKAAENFKKLLGRSKDEVIGLDIGTSAVKIVQLQKDKSGYKVIGAGIAEIENASDPSDAKTQINAISTVRTSLESENFTTKLAVCGLCGPEVAVRYFKFPALAKEEVEGAVTIEATQVCPFNIDNGVVEYTLVPNGQDSVTGFFVAATNKLIKAKKQLADDASARCVLMDVDGLALLNCLSQYENVNNHTATAISNIGNSFTTLAIIGQNNLPFIRDIPYAGREITQQIAAEHGWSVEQVTQALSDTEDTEKQRAFTDSINRCCQKLIVDINETLRYYASQEKSTAVEKILVCGGFSLVPGIIELFERHLDAKVALWNPLEKMSHQPDELLEHTIRKKGPALAVATGLAMRCL